MATVAPFSLRLPLFFAVASLLFATVGCTLLPFDFSSGVDGDAIGPLSFAQTNVSFTNMVYHAGANASWPSAIVVAARNDTGQDAEITFSPAQRFARITLWASDALLHPSPVMVEFLDAGATVLCSYTLVGEAPVTVNGTNVTLPGDEGWETMPCSAPLSSGGIASIKITSANAGGADDTAVRNLAVADDNSCHLSCSAVSGVQSGVCVPPTLGKGAICSCFSGAISHDYDFAVPGAELGNSMLPCEMDAGVGACPSLNTTNVVTEYPPVFLSGDFVNSKLELRFGSPHVSNRLESSIFIGEMDASAPECSYVSQYWEKQFVDSLGVPACSDVFIGVLPWGDTFQCPGVVFEPETDPVAADVYYLPMGVRHREYIADFRGSPVFRIVESFFMLKVRIVREINLELEFLAKSPIHIDVAIVYQDIDLDAMTSDIEFITQTAWPYSLDNMTMTLFPVNGNPPLTVTFSEVPLDPALCPQTNPTNATDGTPLCTQRYKFIVTPNGACTITGPYIADFLIGCRADYFETINGQPTYFDFCDDPLKPTNSTLTFDIVSNDFCPQVEIENRLQAVMVSFLPPPPPEPANGTWANSTHFEVPNYDEFYFPNDPPASSQDSDAAIYDLNGDGLGDMILTGTDPSTGEPIIQVYYQIDFGDFQLQGGGGSKKRNTEAPEPWVIEGDPTGYIKSSMAVTDYNGDGRPDILMSGVNRAGYGCLCRMCNTGGPYGVHFLPWAGTCTGTSGSCDPANPTDCYYTGTPDDGLDTCNCMPPTQEATGFTLLKNIGNGKYSDMTHPNNRASVFPLGGTLQGVKAGVSEFFDVDGNGLLDIVMSGQTARSPIQSSVYNGWKFSSSLGDNLMLLVIDRGDGTILLEWGVSMRDHIQAIDNADLLVNSAFSYVDSKCRSSVNGCYVALYSNGRSCIPRRHSTGETTLCSWPLSTGHHLISGSVAGANPDGLDVFNAYTGVIENRTTSDGITGPTIAAVDIQMSHWRPMIYLGAVYAGVGPTWETVHWNNPVDMADVPVAELQMDLPLVDPAMQASGALNLRIVSTSGALLHSNANGRIDLAFRWLLHARPSWLEVNQEDYAYVYPTSQKEALLRDALKAVGLTDPFLSDSEIDALDSDELIAGNIAFMMATSLFYPGTQGYIDRNGDFQEPTPAEIRAWSIEEAIDVLQLKKCWNTVVNASVPEISQTSPGSLHKAADNAGYPSNDHLRAVLWLIEYQEETVNERIASRQAFGQGVFKSDFWEDPTYAIGGAFHTLSKTLDDFAAPDCDAYPIKTTVMLQMPGGTFIPMENHGIPGIRDGRLKWGDFNQDGLSDLAIAGINDVGAGVFHLLRQENSSGVSFVEMDRTTSFPDPYATLGWKYASVVFEDLNGDGLDDIAVSGKPSLPLAQPYAPVWINQGDGSFDWAHSRVFTGDRQAGNCGAKYYSGVPIGRFSWIRDSNAEGDIPRYIQQEVPKPTAGEATLLLVGSSYVCTHNEGETQCVGDNSFGQYGADVGTSNFDFVPIPNVTSLGTITQWDAAEKHTCAIIESQGYCWGSNLDGQIKTIVVGEDEYFTPQPIGVSGAAHLKVANTHKATCVLLSANHLYCMGNWGGTTPTSTLSIAADDATDVSCGILHCCYINTVRNLGCFGYGGDGQLGVGNTNDYLYLDSNGNTSMSSVAFPSLPASADGVWAFARTTCARLTDGRVFCWGKNSDSANSGFGDTNSDVLVPTEIPDIQGAIKVTGGSDHICALFDDGTAKCVGLNWCSLSSPSAMYSFGTMGAPCPSSGGFTVPFGDWPSYTFFGEYAGKIKDLYANARQTCLMSFDGDVICVGDIKDAMNNSNAAVTPITSNVLGTPRYFYRCQWGTSTIPNVDDYLGSRYDVGFRFDDQEDSGEVEIGIIVQGTISGYSNTSHLAVVVRTSEADGTYIRLERVVATTLDDVSFTFTSETLQENGVPLPPGVPHLNDGNWHSMVIRVYTDSWNGVPMLLAGIKLPGEMEGDDPVEAVLIEYEDPAWVPFDGDTNVGVYTNTLASIDPVYRYYPAGDPLQMGDMVFSEPPGSTVGSNKGLFYMGLDAALDVQHDQNVSTAMAKSWEFTPATESDAHYRSSHRGSPDLLHPALPRCKGTMNIGMLDKDEFFDIVTVGPRGLNLPGYLYGSAEPSIGGSREIPDLFQLQRLNEPLSKRDGGAAAIDETQLYTAEHVRALVDIPALLAKYRDGLYPNGASNGYLMQRGLVPNQVEPATNILLNQMLICFVTVNATAELQSGNGTVIETPSPEFSAARILTVHLAMPGWNNNSRHLLFSRTASTNSYTPGSNTPRGDAFDFTIVDEGVSHGLFFFRPRSNHPDVALNTPLGINIAPDEFRQNLETIVVMRVWYVGSQVTRTITMHLNAEGHVTQRSIRADDPQYSIASLMATTAAHDDVGQYAPGAAESLVLARDVEERSLYDTERPNSLAASTRVGLGNFVEDAGDDTSTTPDEDEYTPMNINTGTAKDAAASLAPFWW